MWISPLHRKIRRVGWSKEFLEAGKRRLAGLLFERSKDFSIYCGSETDFLVERWGFELMTTGRC